MAKDKEEVNDDVSLRDYIEAILDSHDRAHAAEHKAVELAAAEMERRVEGLNQLRQDVITDRGQFVTKDVVDELLKAAAERNHARDEKTAQLADTLEAKTQALAEAIDLRIKPLESTAVTAAALASIKRVIYTTGFATIVAIALAIYSATRPK
jgi:hypothetical protein